MNEGGRSIIQNRHAGERQCSCNVHKLIVTAEVEIWKLLPRRLPYQRLQDYGVCWKYARRPMAMWHGLHEACLWAITGSSFAARNACYPSLQRHSCINNLQTCPLSVSEHLENVRSGIAHPWLLLPVNEGQFLLGQADCFSLFSFSSFSLLCGLAFRYTEYPQHQKRHHSLK